MNVTTPAWPSADERDSLNWTVIYSRPEPDQGHGTLLVARQRQWDRAKAKRLAHLRQIAYRNAAVTVQGKRHEGRYRNA